MAKTRCEVEEFTDVITNEYGQHVNIPSVRARCSRCDHVTVSGGTHAASVTRCLALMREQCPRQARHFYTTDAPRASRRKVEWVRPE